MIFLLASNGGLSFEAAGGWFEPHGESSTTNNHLAPV